jgi:glycosyltransferase involved in cell wall biosynthesis
MDIDVVIASAGNISSKNSSIYFTIRSILAQELLPKNIIVSANSEFNEIKDFISENFGEYVKTIDSTSNKNNISYARNIGVKYCTSDIIVFIDDDVVIGKNEVFSKIAYKMQFEDFYCGAKRFWANPNWDKILDKTYSLNHIRNILSVKSFLPLSIDRFTGRQYFHNFFL